MISRKIINLHVKGQKKLIQEENQIAYVEGNVWPPHEF